MKTDDRKLAIVIPAVKPEHLRAALESVAAQTDQRFAVYVGDDAGPEGIQRICEPYVETLGLSYHRFEHNLGGASLVGHWHRCIELSSEPWIWLFSDDDVMDTHCVEAFYEQLQRVDENVDLFRFSTVIIDGTGRVVRHNPKFPLLESGIISTYRKLAFGRPSYAQEYIFSRLSFEREGGFPDFPMAWCSDDAAWLAFAGGGPIRTLQGPLVRRRIHNRSISGQTQAYQAEKLKACILYIEWLKMRTPSAVSGEPELRNISFDAVMVVWFRRQVRSLDSFVSVNECYRLADYLSRRFGGSFVFHFLCLLTANLVPIWRRPLKWFQSQIRTGG